jgi:DNA-binding NarL/FixJ family response regulator
MSIKHATPPIRILTVDDHPMLREGVAAMIQSESNMLLVGEAEDGDEAIVMFRDLRPDVTLMDLQMPRLNGVGAIKAIRSEFADARIIVLTTYTGDVQVLQALSAGAAGYLLKSTLRREMLATIRAVHEGRRHVPAEIASENARPDGFEPPTTWFEVGSSEGRITEQNQSLAHFELCYVFSRYGQISL